ncbi:hypothetical protein PHYC_00660 [Phycisphaerales bacterium]|nr:hypothetical protein PHYC_00660 [Phycisphaerales bacterium]
MRTLSPGVISSIAGAALCLGGASALGQTTATWLSATNSGNWTNATFWSTDPVFPNNNGPNLFHAVINATGQAYSVTLDQDITIEDFTLDSVDATFILGNFNFTVNGNWLSQAGATVNGQGVGGTIRVSGNTTFNDITLTQTNIISTGPVIYGASTMVAVDDTDIDHGDGSAIWSGPGGITLSNGSTIDNEAACTFTISNAAVMQQGAGATGSFTNRGTIIRDTSAGICDIQGVTFANPGTLEVRTGTFRTDGLALAGNTLAEGVWNVAGGDIDLVGQTVTTNQADVRFTSASGAFAAFDTVTTNDAAGSITIDAVRTFTTVASPFQNDGAINVRAGGTFESTGDCQNDGTVEVGAGSTFEVLPGSRLLNVNVAGDTLAGGEFLVQGAFRADDLTVNLSNLDSKVTLDGPGALFNDGGADDPLERIDIIGTNGELAITNGRNLNPTGDITLNGAGTIRVGAGSVMSINGVVTNLVTGTFTSGALDVAGTLVFNDADIDTVDADLSLNDANASIEDQFGNDAFRNLDTVTTNGSLGITNGRDLAVTGSLATAGNVTIGAIGSGSTLTLPGAYNQSAGITTLRDGTINATGGFNLAGGELRGSGTINGDIVTNGVIGPGQSPGMLMVGGNIQMSPDSVVQIELGGLLGGSGYDQLILTDGGDMSFETPQSGLMQVVMLSGFFPAMGTVFEGVVWAQSPDGVILGRFSRYEGLEANNGYRLEVRYIERVPDGDPSDTFRIDLVVTATPAPGSLALFGLATLACSRRRR